MKKVIHILLLCISTINILLLSPIAASAQSVCNNDVDANNNPKVRVRIANPIQYDQNSLCWTGTYCLPGGATDIEFEDGSTLDPEKDLPVQDCKVYDVPYTDYADKPACTDMDPQNNSSCIHEKYELVGSAQLNQVKVQDSGIGLLKSTIGDIYKWGTTIGSIAAVLVIIISGIQYITAAGDSAKVGTAKERIYQALAALVVLFLSGLILYTINPTFFTK